VVCLYLAVWGSIRDFLVIHDGLAVMLVVVYDLTDNEIDGLAFLELTIDDLNKLMPDKMGIIKRIYRLMQAVS
jgi:hypothetical protein